MSDDIELDPELFVDPDVEAQIEALSVAPNAGCDEAFATALAAHLKDHAEAQGHDVKIPFQGPVALFAHSYAGTYGMSVTNADAGRGFQGYLEIAPVKAGTHFEITGKMKFPGVDGGCALGGTGKVQDADLVVLLEVIEAGRQLTLRGKLGNDFPGPGEDWLPSGTIQCQQAPEDPALNGDIQLAPDDQGEPPQDGHVVLSVVKVPRRDAQGRPVLTGTGDNRQPVNDCYFWRDGRWWRIKDPDLKLRDDPTLIDLRDGTPNPNYEPADSATKARLNRDFFPTGWQDFWKGFDEATARQLQGLTVTLGALTGTDLAVWRKIRRLRDQGKSWAEIWELCWLDILIIVGIAALSAIPITRLLRRIFGPFVGRFVGRFLGRRPGRAHPPIPPGRGSDFLAWLRRQLRELTRRRAEIFRRYRDLQRRSRRSSRELEVFKRTGPRLLDEIGNLTRRIEQLQRRLGGNPF